MNINDITGGVSPLKQRQAHRGGKEAGKATAKKVYRWLSGRGGYEESVGVKGGGGPNVSGYNIHTRFNPRAQPGTAGTRASKPYSYDKDGNLKINTGYEYKQDPDVTRELESYSNFWKSRIDDKSKWSKGMKQYLKGVDMSDSDAVQKAHDEWLKVSKEHEEERNRGSETKTEAGQKYIRSYQIKNGKRVKGSEGPWEKI